MSSVAAERISGKDVATGRIKKAVSTLSEMKVSVTLATIMAVLSAGFGAGAAWVSLDGRIKSLEKDISLQESFSSKFQSLASEISSLRSSVESEAHRESRSNDKLQADHIQSIREALARKGINVN